MLQNRASLSRYTIIPVNILLFMIFLQSACRSGGAGSVRISSHDSALVSLYARKSSDFQKKNPDSAVFYAEKGLQLALKNRYLPGEALLLSRYAAINEQYGNLQAALKQQREALKIYNKLRDDSSVARVSAGLGRMEGELGNIGRGKTLLAQALQTGEESEDTAFMIHCFAQLGKLMERSGDTATALENFRKAEQLSRSPSFKKESYSSVHNLSRLFSKAKNYRQALAYLESGISKSAASGHWDEHIKLLRHAAGIYDSSGDKHTALSYHRKSLQKAQALGDREEEALSLMGMASVVQRQDTEQSIGHLKKALSIARSIGHKDLESEIYRSLSGVYRQQSRFNEALHALELHYALVDSLQKKNTGIRVAALQGSNALAQSKVRIEALELANQKRTTERNFFVLSAIAVLLLLFVFIRHFYKVRNLNKSLSNANTVKDKLFSIIGHDLRNPVGGIAQALALMEEEEMQQDEYRPMIAELRKQADASLQILNTLLKWGEAQLKGIHIYRTTFAPQKIIHQNMEVLHKQSADKDITIRDTIPAGLKIKGDANHFDFIIRNLISNAIKFSYPSGSIEIGAVPEPGTQKIVFSVRDQGKGMSKEQLSHFGSENPGITFGTSGEKGTGLGLMLCREFILADKGRMWAESEENKGTTVYFSFGKVSKWGI